MIDKTKYIPFLKGKKGEFTALEKLPDEIKDGIIPVIDVVTLPNKSIDEVVASVIGYFDSWDKVRLIYIDCYMIDDEGLLDSGTHPAKYLIESLLAKEFSVLPVFNNVIRPEHKQIIKEVAEQIGRGSGLRIYDTTIEGINNEIEESLSFLNLVPEQIDLIIDLRSLIDAVVQSKIEFVKELFDNLRYLSRWRRVVLAGGNFPLNLTKITANTVKAIPRKIWEIWKEVTNNQRINSPTFSDYCISHIEIDKLRTKYPNASASIRYTQHENFYIYRGRGTQQYKYRQFFDISEALINGSHYFGKEHCKGCEFIYKCGTEKKKPGSLTTWRWVGTAHHITVVVNQLRQFFRDLSA